MGVTEHRFYAKIVSVNTIHEDVSPTKNPTEVNSGATEGLAVPTPLVAPVFVLFLSNIRC